MKWFCATFLKQPFLCAEKHFLKIFLCKLKNFWAKIYLKLFFDDWMDGWMDGSDYYIVKAKPFSQQQQQRKLQQQWHQQR